MKLLQVRDGDSDQTASAKASNLGNAIYSQSQCCCDRGVAHLDPVAGGARPAPPTRIRSQEKCRRRPAGPAPPRRRTRVALNSPRASRAGIGTEEFNRAYLAARKRRRPQHRAPRQPAVAAEAKLLKRNRIRRRVALPRRAPRARVWLSKQVNAAKRRKPSIAPRIYLSAGLPTASDVNRPREM